MSKYGNLNVSQLSPDGFSRFRILIDTLQLLFKGAKPAAPLKILDVGGSSEYMQQQLNSTGLPYDLTVIDILEKPKRMKARYVQGDASDMDFADNSFDVVISTDVLEHVPTPRKAALVKECLRVAKEAVIIAAPFDTPGVNAAEVQVNELNKKLFGAEQEWLKEHLEIGKPTPAMMERALKAYDGSYIHFGTQNCTVWMLNTISNLIEARYGLSSRQHIRVNEFYNTHIYQMNEFSPPTYRHFYVVAVSARMKAMLPTIRFMTKPTNDERYAEYLAQLMQLYADRIAMLEKQLRRSQRLAHRRGLDVQRLLAAANEHQTELGRLRAKVDSVRPLLALAHNPVTKRLRRGGGRDS